MGFAFAPRSASTRAETQDWYSFHFVVACRQSATLTAANFVSVTASAVALVTYPIPNKGTSFDVR